MWTNFGNSGRVSIDTLDHSSGTPSIDNYQLAVDQVLTEYQSGCWLSIDRGVDWGYWLREIAIVYGTVHVP